MCVCTWKSAASVSLTGQHQASLPGLKPSSRRVYSLTFGPHRVGFRPCQELTRAFSVFVTRTQTQARGAGGNERKQRGAAPPLPRFAEKYSSDAGECLCSFAFSTLSGMFTWLSEVTRRREENLRNFSRSIRTNNSRCANQCVIYDSDAKNV